MQAEELQTFLSAQSGQPVKLVVTDNRWSLLSLRRAPWEPVVVRVARLFLEAPAEVWRAIAVCVRRRDHGAWRRIRQFVNQATASRSLPPGTAPKRLPRIVTRGRVHDLAPIAAEVNARHFGGAVTAAITWGRATRRRGRRRITFGTYHHARRLIRIHPRLDDARVPEFFLRAIVFHEMLHAALGTDGDTAPRLHGRRIIHSPEFRRREREFPDSARARAWEKENLRLFLS